MKLTEFIAEKTSKAKAIAQSHNVLSRTKALNVTLTESELIKPLLMGHYVSLKNSAIAEENKDATEQNGIKGLILAILNKNGAVFQLGAENGENASEVLEKSMLVSEIEAQVKIEFSKNSIRYNHNTVKTYLGTFMSRDTVSKKTGALLSKQSIVKLNLESWQDDSRESKKPRTAFYAIAK